MIYRPASLDLPQLPLSAFSTPDGSCLLLLNKSSDGVSFTAYHWPTFGASEGSLLEFPNVSPYSISVTSLVNRNIVHVLMLSEDYRCQSYALDITKKTTEFTFKPKESKATSSGNGAITGLHNCLIDCHADVWTRFPVIAAVQRRTITASRCRKRINFVTDRDCDRYQPHFRDLIQSFEQRTRKPTGDELKSILVTAIPHQQFAPRTCFADAWGVSTLKAGEWIVDIFCLIPLHIAICRENRFVPLKDGISSAELERSLLGADVSTIVDSVTFGWWAPLPSCMFHSMLTLVFRYESIFQSYMASKVRNRLLAGICSARSYPVNISAAR